MKKHISILLLFLPLIVFFLMSCKEKQQVNYIPISDALKTACFFQKDSYWIYRNDSTGVTDTTYIKTNPISGDSTEGNYMVDYIRTPLKSGILYDFYIEGEHYVPPLLGRLFTFLRTDGGCCRLVAFNLYNDTLINHTGGYGCNCGSWKYPMEASNTYVEKGEYSGFNVNDLVFDKVEFTRTKFIHTPSNGTDIDSIDFYFSPGNGFVKLVMRIDTSYIYQVQKRVTISWSLLRYNVVQ